jgi:phenylpropionate dioxygenase-like ring-hydroxylating dioxygenase large terminal subunit
MSSPTFSMPGTEIYWNPEIYQRELERIYGTAWLFVGHNSMIPAPGDYISNFMGNDPIILCRDKSSHVQVYLNRCRHRGNKVCLFDSGNTRSFRCNYHGWTYDLEGRLAGVPQLDKAYDADFPRSSLGLVSPAHIATHRGMIFATWNEHAPSLESFLGEDLLWYLDTFALDDPEGLEVLPGRHRYKIPANWKFLAENFGGDMYHFASTHASVAKLQNEGRAGRIQSISDSEGPDNAYYSVDFREAGQPAHGILQLSFGEAALAEERRNASNISADAQEWVRERQERRRRLVAERKSKPTGFHTGTIWPNLSLNGFGSAIYARTLLQWHPTGPESIIACQWAFVEKSAPPEVKERMAFVLTHRQAAAGMVAPDDVDNFQRIRDVLHTARAGKIPYNFDLGAKRDESLLPDLPGHVMEALTEGYHRSFYRYWGEAMSQPAPE